MQEVSATTHLSVPEVVHCLQVSPLSTSSGMKSRAILPESSSTNMRLGSTVTLGAVPSGAGARSVWAAPAGVPRLRRTRRKNPVLKE